MTDIKLLIHARNISLFLPLLEKGLVLPAKTGCSVKAFLCGQLGLAETYLDQRIQTLFLDARPVDNVDTAVIKDGATLALSAAMPGLLGASMRKGGRYAAFRKDISQAAEVCTQQKMNGRVKVKLFNMVAKEIGSELLAKGGEINGNDLKRIADYHPDTLVQTVKNVRIDGKPADPDRAFFLKMAGRQVNLTITMAQTVT